MSLFIHWQRNFNLLAKGVFVFERVLSCILNKRFIFIEWHDERREVESQRRSFKSLHTLTLSVFLAHRHVWHGFINIRLVFGFAPAVEISLTLNSVAPITSASTRFSISIITGSAYNLGHVQVSRQTFQALALSLGIPDLAAVVMKLAE